MSASLADLKSVAKSFKLTSSFVVADNEENKENVAQNAL